ncbi:glycosyltransferase [Paenibacillus alkaliterrae]|uniref:glycosyltransferase n=1 Tax=Paenibacillus alkaliterrae TaxID=320909 RepID=UPI001F2AA2F7|nr:glycosyltransferase [Paenibacillus alkaliterrae]MCF2940383.1 glycosyltransferase [Paenibacillus alkaliterrae]
MLLVIARELQPYFEVVLVVPNEGVLSTEARHFGVVTVVEDYSTLHELYQPVPDVEELFQNLAADPKSTSLLNLLHIHRPDLIMTNTCVNVLPAVAGKMLGIPVAWIIAEVIQENQWTSLSVDIIHRYSDWLVGISHAALKSFNSPDMESKKIVLPPSWSMVELAPETWQAHRIMKRTQLGLNDSHTVIGYISSDIYANKGLKHFVEMAVTLCPEFPEARFMVIGKAVDPDFFASCMNIIEQNGYTSRVFILPFEQNIVSLYPAMDIVVVPSLWNEGFGLTALEGLVFGKPVVAYRSGGLIEILTSTGNGPFLAEQGNVADLTMKVKSLVQDSALRMQVGERSSRAAQEVFGIGAFRERLNQFLPRVIPVIEAKKSSHQVTQLKYPNGSVIKGNASTLVFLLENGVKRHIVNEEVFQFYRWKWDQVMGFPDVELQAFPTGRPISRNKPLRLHAPSHFVAKGSGPAIYIMHNGIRHPFSSEAVFRKHHHYDQIVALTDLELEEYTLGTPIAASGKAPSIKRRKGAKHIGRLRNKRIKHKGKLTIKKRSTRTRIRKLLPRKMKASKRVRR